ncbi:hypothetical protein [Desulfovirgula thermocuniculi]|uniref:hypothetical protein n=1 Tax=Desulfovirgula thermocuniculi TaxID=348842 RepID=UPI00040B8E68|nr:hypothetical protein [Desulfovirgula thermocuniculi]
MKYTHDFALPREFGRTLSRAVAYCRRCGAEWDVHRTALGVQWRPKNEVAKTPYCKRR